MPDLRLSGPLTKKYHSTSSVKTKIRRDDDIPRVPEYGARGDTPSRRPTGCHPSRWYRPLDKRKRVSNFFRATEFRYNENKAERLRL
ncbi:hypothetical protein EVAR_27793_1 [Eumeta japonica]|uniref:Uncharacterized protein n=1 Tax=Eumeta variegata TaxID=151549 RepID=A0A4C1VJY0_EUMVA|nr:hypothetical protein EVAR_27793_1 [Eumeta japonica]